MSPPPKAISLLSGCVLFLFSAFATSAQADDCASALTGGYQHLLDHEAQCSHLADFNYQLGLRALQQSDHNTAINAFQRVTLQNPNHAGAWLDLATLYFRIQDRQSLAATLQQIEQRFAVPPAIELILERYRNWLAQSQRSPRRLQAAVEIELGHSTNINHGTSHDSINLGGLDVEISDASRPLEDSFTAATLQLSWDQPLYSWQTQIWTALREQQYDRFDDYNSRWGLIGVNGQRGLGSDRRLSLSLYRLWLDSGDVSNQTNTWFQARLLQRWQDNLATTGWLTLQSVDATNQSDSDQQKLGLQLSLNQLGWQWQLAGEYGRDTAREFRSGGDRDIGRLWLDARRPLADGTLNLYVEWQAEYDQKPFNQLLFGDVKRDREQMRAEARYQFPIAKQHQMTVWAGYQQESSDIDLFDSKGWQGGLRWQWLWQP
ncbi:tetratricopeptide repeat protein [Marinobacterium arenosum]|uniref:tetratricopeptide repeat protein n=1 Tax=Marinobacterium arenosum TaxID=2862496 RepID=UPI001C9600AC|nr:hypothetical protein [Marinobacterium arenosum]MBY4676821.1 hypothetical protein [Marinobacterium arenosum]